MRKTPKHVIRKAIKIAGGQAELARLIGVKSQYVWNWINRDSGVPAEYVIPIEKATGVTRQELRPDIYPA